MVSPNDISPTQDATRKYQEAIAERNAEAGPGAMMGAMLLAVQGQCDCKPCKVLRVMAKELTERLLKSVGNGGCPS